MNKKAQGLPLNTIVIAIIVLVVLVVLIAIFTGRIAVFDQGVADESNLDIIKQQALYGKCRPDAAVESSYKSCLASAGNAATAADVDVATQNCKQAFGALITECKTKIAEQCASPVSSGQVSGACMLG